MDFHQRLNKHYELLSQTEKHAMSEVLKSLQQVSELTIKELSLITNTSTTTIHRALEKLGYDGFSEFKYSLNQKEKIIEPKEDFDEFLDKRLTTTLKYLKESEIDQIIHEMQVAKRVYCYGTGYKQETILEAFINDFISYDKEMTLIRAETDLKSSIQRMTDEDLLIIASLSGNTLGLDEIIKRAQIHRVKILSITEKTVNHLAVHADYSLYFSDDRYPDDRLPWPAFSMKLVFDYIVFEYGKRKIS